MEVTIKPIAANAWLGIDRYPNCVDHLGPYFTRSGSIYTGLTKEDADRLGSILGLDLRPSSEFWTTFRVGIGSSPLKLNLDDPLDELKYLHLKNHKRVKSSFNQNKATANYYISNPEDEAGAINANNRIKTRAITEFSKLKAADIRKCLRVFGYKADPDYITNEVAESRLFQLVETNPKNFLDKWVDNKNRATEFLIKEAQSQGIIKKTGNAYFYNETRLGPTLREAILTIDSPENSEMKAAIVNEAKVK